MVLRWWLSLQEMQDKETSQLYFIFSTRSHLEREIHTPFLPLPMLPWPTNLGMPGLGGTHSTEPRSHGRCTTTAQLGKSQSPCQSAGSWSKVPAPVSLHETPSEQGPPHPRPPPQAGPPGVRAVEAKHK